MSWDPYVKALTDGGFHLGCIAGHNGQVWGTTPSFKPATVEIKKLNKILSSDSDAMEKVMQRGFTLQGMPYALTRIEGEHDECSFLIGRCKEHGAPSRGAIVARTAQTIVVGIHDPIYSDNLSFGKGHVTIFQLAEALAGMNF